MTNTREKKMMIPKSGSLNSMNKLFKPSPLAIEGNCKTLLLCKSFRDALVSYYYTPPLLLDGKRHRKWCPTKLADITEKSQFTDKTKI